MTMKKVDKRIFAAAAILAISAFAAESVEWPADFDSNLSARIEAAKPSGQQCAASAFSGFDSITHDDMIATIAELRNFIKPGFVLTFR